MTNGSYDRMLPPYPETRRDNLVESIYGVDVADPYRWLEEDVRNSSDVADWAKRQQAYTEHYLANLPERDAFANNLKHLLDYETFGSPDKRGDRLFYTYNPGLADQDVLMMQPASDVKLDGSGAVLLDPNKLSGDGTVALTAWEVSPSGRLLAFQTAQAGSDWTTLQVLDIDSGNLLPDRLVRLKGGAISWSDDSCFFYSRFPEPAKGEDFQVAARDMKIYRHCLGDPQSADAIFYETPDQPDLMHGATISVNGRWLIVSSSKAGALGNQLRAFDLANPSRDAITIAAGNKTIWHPVGTIGDRLYIKTDKDAPRYRLMAMDLGSDLPELGEVVAQAEGAIENVAIVDEHIAIDYLEDVKSRLQLYDAEGQATAEVSLPGIGAIGGLHVEPQGNRAWFSFSSFNRPSELFAFDVRTGESHSVIDRELMFDPAGVTTEQVFYPSADGTMVPMFIVRRADSTGPAPTLLYAYGGFNITLAPAYSSARMAWIQAGGTYALANIRGGGEYGSAWHRAAVGPKRENAFADFIAAGEWLKANGVAGKDQLAIQGGSNGGLLMGVVTNRRPDLFDAVNPQVGVMDMLRFDRWGYGKYWTSDYGDPANEEDFAVLMGYSPYHNVPAHGVYPPILVTTADTDDRVIPGHSFKYAAALQAADLGPAPRLIRIESKAGHGAGMPVSKLIANSADVLGFLARFTGLTADIDEEYGSGKDFVS